MCTLNVNLALAPSYTFGYLIQVPGVLSLSTKFLPTIMNMLRKLAEEGNRPANAGRHNPSPVVSHYQAGSSAAAVGNRTEYSSSSKDERN